MVEVYIGQIEVLGINYADPEHGITANGKVMVDFGNSQYISSFVAHPKTKVVKLAIEIDYEKLGIPKSMNLKTRLKRVILGQVGKVNLPLIKRIPLD